MRRSFQLYAPIALVTLLAIGLRFYRIDAQSLWYDEGISAHQLTRSYAQIVAAAALDTHPPLYYWTLKAWGSLFGASELGLRSLSAVWGGVAVVLTWLIGRRLFGPLAGLMAALLLACSPLAVYYSQEVRMYAQVTALGLLAAWVYLRRWYAVYVVAAAATLYSQYLGAAFLVAVNVHALVSLRGRREWLIWLGSNVLVALVFLPWLPTFVAQQSHALNVSPRTAPALALSTLNAYGGGLASGDLSLVGGCLLVALGVLGFLLRPRPASLPLLLWLVPLGLVIALGLRNGLFELRYLDLGIPGLALLVGALSAGLQVHAQRDLSGRVGRKAPQGIAVLIVALVALVPAVPALQREYFDPSLFRDDYRGVVQTIETESRPTDAIVLSAPNQSEVFDFYYHGPLPVVPLPAERPIDPVDTQQRLEALKAQHPRAWLVEWAMNEADPPGVIATWIARNGFQSSHAWYGTLQLALVSFGADQAAQTRVDLPLSNGVVLDAYQVPTALKPGETLPLSLVWRTQASPGPVPWKVFTHLLDANQQVVAQRDSEPLSGLEPTTTWQPGQVVEDHYGIPLPADMPVGTYTLEIGMYQGDQRATFDGRGDHLVLGSISVSP